MRNRHRRSKCVCAAVLSLHFNQLTSNFDQQTDISIQLVYTSNVTVNCQSTYSILPLTRRQQCFALRDAGTEE